MPIVFLSSFPDSRNYPRAATKRAVNTSGTINHGIANKIVDGDENSTYVTLRSNSSSETLYIYYVDIGLPAPTYNDILNLGMIVQAYDGYEIESKQDVYATTVANDINYRVDNGKG